MNIAFWSTVRHQSGVTASVAITGILWVELFMEGVEVTSNHICNNGLERRLYGGSEYEERAAKKAYSYLLGEPEYFRMLYNKKRETTLWLNDNLRYVPMEGGSGEMFGVHGLGELGKKAHQKEYRLIDTASGFGLNSQEILEEAEVTVILFPPQKESIDAFFCSESGLAKESFFILGNYRGEQECRPVYLTKQYSIPEERIGIIPYNIGFEQAMKEGSTISYITRNMFCSKRNGAYHFMYNATKTVKKLREYAKSRRDER